jgi:hypothetical protein
MKRRPRLSSFALSASILVAAAGCGSVSPEQKIVQDFFRAARLNDNAALATFATASFDRRQHGQVQRFEVVEIGPERSTPAPIRELADAVEAALTKEKAFSQEKMTFQTENLSTIERVVEFERKKQPIAKKDLAVQVAWAKWRADSAEHARAVSDARQKLQAARRVIELSLSEPNGPTPDVSRMDGELIEKDVTVSADVRTPEGQVVQRTLVVTLARASMRAEGSKEPVSGRWLVRRVRGTDPEKPTA